MEEEPEFYNIDANRSKLSSLFHCVSEACMVQEFQLIIAYVFDYPNEEYATENVSSAVARGLCMHVIGDPKHGFRNFVFDPEVVGNSLGRSWYIELSTSLTLASFCVKSQQN
jgi:hypothetical protein